MTTGFAGMASERTVLTMLNSDIIEATGAEMERKIGGEWKHQIMILGMSSVHINFDLDGKEYVLRLYEVAEGHDWSEFVNDHLPPIGGDHNG